MPSAGGQRGRGGAGVTEVKLPDGFHESCTERAVSAAAPQAQRLFQAQVRGAQGNGSKGGGGAGAQRAAPDAAKREVTGMAPQPCDGKKA